MDKSLIYSGQNLKNYELIEGDLRNKSNDLIYLDLSNNLLNDFNLKINFKSLQILIIDHNNLTTLKNFPVLKLLDTLSINDNSITSATDTVIICLEKFPSLKLVNTVRNPMNPSMEKYDEYKSYRILWKKIKALESLDGVSLVEESVLDVYKSKVDYDKHTTPMDVKKISIVSQSVKVIKEEDEEEYEVNNLKKKNQQVEELDDNDLQSIIKQNKRHSTISYSQKILKKANNLTKFNKKNNSEGNKHILNSDL